MNNISKSSKNLLDKNFKVLHMRKQSQSHPHPTKKGKKISGEWRRRTSRNLWLNRLLLKVPHSQSHDYYKRNILYYVILIKNSYIKIFMKFKLNED